MPSADEKPFGDAVSDPRFRDCIAWFCLRSHPKREHIAAAHLRQYEEIQVFNPRVKFTRVTRLGKSVVTESLFPNYLFARFNWKVSLNRIHYSPGISGIVHFGERWPTIPDGAIEELRQFIGDDEVREIPYSVDMKQGDEVEVVTGAFQGLTAVVTRVMPGRDRVTILLDFLGRQTSVEVPAAFVIRNGIRK